MNLTGSLIKRGISWALSQCILIIFISLLTTFYSLLFHMVLFICFYMPPIFPKDVKQKKKKKKTLHELLDSARY